MVFDVFWSVEFKFSQVRFIFVKDNNNKKKRNKNF